MCEKRLKKLSLMLISKCTSFVNGFVLILQRGKKKKMCDPSPRSGIEDMSSSLMLMEAVALLKGRK